LQHGCSKRSGKSCDGMGRMDGPKVRSLNGYGDLRRAGNPWTARALASQARGRRFEPGPPLSVRPAISRTSEGLPASGFSGPECAACAFPLFSP
jgi:hypothetical protein